MIHTNPLFAGVGRLPQQTVDQARNDVEGPQGVYTPMGTSAAEMQLLGIAARMRAGEEVIVPDHIRGLSEAQQAKLANLRAISQLRPQDYCGPNFRREAAAEFLTKDVASILDHNSEGMPIELPSRDPGVNATATYRVRKAIQHDGWGCFILVRESSPSEAHDPEVFVVGRPTAQAEFQSIMHNLADTSGQLMVEAHADELIGALQETLRETGATHIGFDGYSQGGAIAAQYLIKALNTPEAKQLRTIDTTLWHNPGLSFDLARQLREGIRANPQVQCNAMFNHVKHDQVSLAGDVHPFVGMVAKNLRIDYRQWERKDISAGWMWDVTGLLGLHTCRATQDWDRKPCTEISVDYHDLVESAEMSHALREETGPFAQMRAAHKERFKAARESIAKRTEALKKALQTRLGGLQRTDQKVIGWWMQKAVKEPVHLMADPQASWWQRCRGAVQFTAGVGGGAAVGWTAAAAEAPLVITGTVAAVSGIFGRWRRTPQHSMLSTRGVVALTASA
ncbi:MAG: hypothetical protein SP1CHLAM54_00520 [Chlamydiia bacterium]|nr:hypothetical protein [Chlamydiia bacterium]MCH9614974.1 hypothetical protein [Chlamydiia bacterium]MCH9629976.1 hypothetical protein [Chlamydiia bacterium]